MTARPSAAVRLWTWVERHPTMSLTVAAAVLYLLRLGSSDLRQWDEVFYASRALVAGREGRWLDQSTTALGGLWTGSHPPLVIWMMGLAGRLAGFSEWTFRLPVALCGLALVLVLRRLVADLTRSRRVALLAGAVLLLTPYFTRYARMGQLDVPVLLWVVLALLSFWRGLQGGVRWTVLAGVAFGLALLSKLAVGFLVPLTIVLFLAWEGLRGSKEVAARGLAALVVLSALGLLLAAPWFVAITLRLGRTYWDQALGYHVLARMKGPLEGHASSLGMFYWPTEVVGRLAAFTPFLVLGMGRAAAAALSGTAARRFLWSWLLVPLVLLSLSATTYHTYLFLFLLPLVVFVALGLHSCVGSGITRTAFAWLTVTAVASLVWAQTSPLHRALEQVAAALRALEAPAAAGAALLAGFAALVVLLGLAASAFVKRAAARTFERLGLRAVLALVFLPAFVTAWQPVVSGKAEWIALRRSVLRSGCRAVVFEGEDTPVNRMNLSLLEARGVTVAWEARVDSARAGRVEAGGSPAGPCHIALMPRASRSR